MRVFVTEIKPGAEMTTSKPVNLRVDGLGEGKKELIYEPRSVGSATPT